MLLAFSFQDLFNAFKPVIVFLQGLWDYLNTGVYTAYSNTVLNIPVLGTVYKRITDFIADTTGLDEFLNQYTVLSVSLAGGLTIVIILSIVGFFTDKVGL